MSEHDVISLVANCTIPWRSLDSCSVRKLSKRENCERVLDGKDLMLKCFNCQKEECDNCHDMQHSDKRMIRMREAKETFLLYYSTGFNRSQICKVMRISVGTYNRYLRIFVLGKDK